MLLAFQKAKHWGESSGSSIFFGKYNGSWSGVTTSQSLPLNEWSHIAVSCQGGVATIYLNGQSIGSGSFTPEINGNTIYVGRRWDENGNINYFNGYIDDLRIINEIALYTENFTPPTAELEVYP